MSWKIRIPIKEDLDRRNADRLILKAEVDVIDVASEKRIKGEVRDISVTGLKVHLPKYVAPGTKLFMYLKLPGDEKEEELKIYSEIKWCRQVGENEFIVGLSYLHVEPQDQEKLVLLVSELMLNWIMSAQEGLIDYEDKGCSF